MDNYLLPCCTYPTEVVNIDDDKNLGKWLSLELSDCARPRSFTNPHEALNYLLSKPNNTFADRVIGKQDTLNLHLLHTEALNPAPLETAVIIVDFEMPELNGLDVCRELMDHPAKKIILTGQADHFIGVQAFHDRLINRFILKSIKNLGRVVREAVHELQNEYFQDLSHFVWDEITFETHQTFMKDPLFVQYFRQFLKHNYIEAFYLWKDGSRFLLRDHNQALFWFVIYEQDTLQKMVTKAKYVYEQEPHRDNEPTLTKIVNFSEIPCFYPLFDDHWSLQDWARYLHPAVNVQGKLDTYTYAFFPATGLYSV